jgi:hypothetical protein
MKNNIKKFSFIILSAVIISSCSKDKNSPTSPNLEHDQALIGTWVLTQITSPIVTTPEALGISLTAVFSSDGKTSLTTVELDSTTTDSGTWGTSDGKITITLEGEDPVTSSYSVNGNTATINQYPVNFQGALILASLEFTKQ